VTRALATVRLAAWTAALVAAVRILDTLGRGPLSVPLRSPGELAAWVETTPTADMVAAVLRLVALGACVHLLGATILAVVVRAAGLEWLDAVADRVTPELVRRVVTSASGLGLVLGGAAALPPLPRAGTAPGHLLAAAPPADRGTASMVRLPPATATMTRQPDGTPAAAAPDAPATATMARVADEPPTTADGVAPVAVAGDPPRPVRPASDGPGPSAPAPAVDVAPPAAGPAAPGATPAPPLPEVDPTVWVVEQGDSFWSIAAQVAGAGDRATHRYWRWLVEANRARLADPGNPDLLVPGQRLVLPPPEA
jgi:hypothetical protein